MDNAFTIFGQEREAELEPRLKSLINEAELEWEAVGDAVESRLYSDPHFPYLGASPDYEIFLRHRKTGVEVTGLIELKSPSARRFTPAVKREYLLQMAQQMVMAADRKHPVCIFIESRAHNPKGYGDARECPDPDIEEHSLCVIDRSTIDFFESESGPSIVECLLNQCCLFYLEFYLPLLDLRYSYYKKPNLEDLKKESNGILRPLRSRDPHTYPGSDFKQSKQRLTLLCDRLNRRLQWSAIRQRGGHTISTGKGPDPWIEMPAVPQSSEPFPSFE
mmetsp:Transcript_39998/g.103306  ORF Transcript_39998/g.103306 Transcript_39998/m.103306 type:complete len:276 (+) Transcript_39998:13102-13929(+)